MAEDNKPAEPTTPEPAQAKPADKPEGQKEFSLKPIQQQMLQVLQDQYFNGLSNFLSFLALEFWGYTVTQNTKFEVQDGKVLIHEGPPPPDAPPTDVATAAGPIPPTPANPGVKPDEPSIA